MLSIVLHLDLEHVFLGAWALILYQRRWVIPLLHWIWEHLWLDVTEGLGSLSWSVVLCQRAACLFTQDLLTVHGCTIAQIWLAQLWDLLGLLFNKFLVKLNVNFQTTRDRSFLLTLLDFCQNCRVDCRSHVVLVYTHVRCLYGPVIMLHQPIACLGLICVLTRNSLTIVKSISDKLKSPSRFF